MNKVIIKQGYLKKLPKGNMNKMRSSFIRPDKRWFVFGVLNKTDPYIEYYESEEGIFTGSPMNSISLKRCTKVEAAVRLGKHANIFSIVTHERSLSLLAETSSSMDEWCKAIQKKLIQLQILEDPGEHVYTDVERPTHKSTRRAPPPIPSYEDSEAGAAAACYEEDDYDDAGPPPRPPGRDGMLRRLVSDSPVSSPTGASSHVVRRTHSMAVDSPPEYQPPSQESGAAAFRHSFSDSSDLHSTPLPAYTFSPSDAPATGLATYHHRNSGFEGGNLSVLPEKMVEALGLSDDPVGGWNAPPPEEGAPPPYLPRAALNRTPSKSLKDTQVEKLMVEKEHQGGVKVTLQRIDCQHAICFVDMLGSVWIAGWNQKMRPYLNNAFHIGDRVVSINGQVLECSKMAKKLIKNSDEEDKITFILNRIPFGRPLLLKRKEQNEALGFSRLGGTAEINDVVPFGVAAQQGLTDKSRTPDGTSFCNWCLTEINNRPLNLFFKDDEIEHRLQAVGTEISILVQPIDFVKELKKQLKTQKFFKDFIVQ